MKRVLLFVALAACTEPKTLSVLSDSNRAFTPAQVTLNRFPAVCGAPPSTPFADGDTFTLAIRGAPDGSGDATTIQVVYHRTLPIGQGLPVDLGDLQVLGSSGSQTFLGQVGSLPLDNNLFSWEQGPNPSEIDANALSNVTVRIDDLAEAEGELSTLTIRLQFTDGGVYDVQVGAHVDTPPTACAG